jgi:hypothetical protein
MQDFRTRLRPDDPWIYQSAIDSHWEQVLRCDGCLDVVEREELIALTVTIDRTHCLPKSVHAEIHQSCLPELMIRIRQGKK